MRQQKLATQQKNQHNSPTHSSQLLPIGMQDMQRQICLAGLTELMHKMGGGLRLAESTQPIGTNHPICFMPQVSSVSHTLESLWLSVKMNFNENLTENGKFRRYAYLGTWNQKNVLGSLNVSPVCKCWHI